MRAAVLLPLILLTGCATTQQPEPIIRTVEVKVPVSTPCVPDNLPAEPTYSDSDSALLAAADAAARYQLLTKGRTERIARSLATEPVLNACRKPAQTKVNP